MAIATENDWAGKILAFFFGAAALVATLVFVVDRTRAVLAPEQYAAERAAERAAEEAAEAAAAARRVEVEAAQAVRAAAAREQELAFNLASDALGNFKASLRDPQAARFRDVWAVRGELNGVEIVAACGVVNAPNAFGAYAGDTPFMAAASRIYTPDHPSFAGLFQQICLDGVKLVELPG